MLQTLRSKILAISKATVVVALAITGAATYSITRGSIFQTIEEDLNAITAGNTPWTMDHGHRPVWPPKPWP